MFEVPQDKQETKKMGVLIGVVLIVVFVAAGVGYFSSRHGAQEATFAAAPAERCTPDAVKDLFVDTAKMDKDHTGVWAVWVVNIHNKSAGCTYTNIEYESTYLRADETVLLINTGTLNGEMAPREEKTFPELRDALFPEGTAYFRFRIKGAKTTNP